MPGGRRIDPAPSQKRAAQKAVAASKTAPPAQPQSPSRGSAPAPEKNLGQKALYDEALALYDKGRYAQAEARFQEFMGRFPKSSLAANALYWIGECRYSTKAYDSAILVFQEVISKYPRHPKAAAALLKAGYAYENLNDKANALFYWRILLDDYPNSAPAGLARKRMAQG